MIYYTVLAQGPYGLEDVEYGVALCGCRVAVELVDRWMNEANSICDRAFLVCVALSIACGPSFVANNELAVIPYPQLSLQSLYCIFSEHTIQLGVPIVGIQ